MAAYLVESALLAHGLPGISNDMLRDEWPQMCSEIVWMEEGRIVTGGSRAFCDFRKKADSAGRIHAGNLREKQKEKATGALTASATILVCREKGIPLAVAGGIGGLKQGQKKSACHDLLALAEGGVSLLATAPKDMFDLQYTIETFGQEGIRVVGMCRPACSGYIFTGEEVCLGGRLDGKISDVTSLVLNEIPAERRIADRKILERAVLYGTVRQNEGASFHPSVNEKLDEQTRGYSSWIQLGALIENVKQAALLTE